MPDHPAAEQIRAAGAVLWRQARAGHEVALIHRMRYDDWSFPKGKREPGEHLLVTAVREVAEETGIRIILGRRLGPARYQNGRQPKRVDYWVARAAADGQAAFVPNDEVDKMDWLGVTAARGRLSYPHDADLLTEFSAGPAKTTPLILVRHASAGSKRDWAGDDLDRPLDSRGVLDATRLAMLLSCFGRCRVLTSAAERCIATVRPYAAQEGAALEIVSALTAGNADSRVGGVASEAAAAVAAVVDARQPAVICVHRENLPPLLSAACHRLGAPVPHGHALHKGGFWVLHTADGTLAGAEQHHPGEVG
jgi:8-oxo-(d)GTP phosphatase